jgi:hypothetical protein
MALRYGSYRMGAKGFVVMADDAKRLAAWAPFQM